MRILHLLVTTFFLSTTFSLSYAGIVRLVLDDGTNTDETLVGFNVNATDGFDIYDSEKMFPAGVPLIYTSAAGTLVAINTLNSVATNPRVAVRVRFPVAGNFSISATEITGTVPVVLEDRLLNVFQNLNSNSTYNFSAVSGTLNNRFVLHFGQAWLGTTSSDWESASNWSHGFVPTGAGHVVLSPLATFQPVVSALPGSPAVCAALTVRAGASLSVAPGQCAHGQQQHAQRGNASRFRAMSRALERLSPAGPSLARGVFAWHSSSSPAPVERVPMDATTISRPPLPLQPAGLSVQRV
jgi:hypothetical protein